MVRRNKFKTCKNKMNKRVNKIVEEVVDKSDWYNKMTDEEKMKYNQSTNWGCF